MLVCMSLKTHALNVSINQLFVKRIIFLLEKSCPNCILQECEISDHVTDKITC